VFKHLLQHVKAIMYPAGSSCFPLLQSLVSPFADPVVKICDDLDACLKCNLSACLLLCPFSDVLADARRKQHATDSILQDFRFHFSTTGGRILPMRTLQQAMSVLLCLMLASAILARNREQRQTGYTVVYSGGSFPSVKPGENLRLYMNQNQLILVRGKDKDEPLVIPPSAVTELSYGAEVHRRVGTAIGVGIVTLGIGGLIALSHSKKHYIGIVWDAGEGKKGGVVLQADKDEFRGILAALEGITGKKAVTSISSQGTIVVE
jgi:hypothetical protein